MVDKYAFLIPLVGMPLGAIAAAKVSLYFAEKKRKRTSDICIISGTVMRTCHEIWFANK